MDDNKRFTEYKGNIIAVASQTVIDDTIMVTHLVKIPSEKFCHGSHKMPQHVFRESRAQPMP